MPLPHTRRTFLRGSLTAAAACLLPVRAFAQAVPTPPPKPPAIAAAQVQEMIVESHRNLERVKQLVEATPLLVNACWDWGGGDFETPLEATAHTGRREIAEFLLSRHARLNIFVAGMLGWLEVVKAAVALDPTLPSVPGPHGFTLYHCVRTGGARAQPVLDFLHAQGVPEVGKIELPYQWPESAR